MASPNLVCPALTIDSAIDARTTEFILFLHPGYDDPQNILFRLSRVDVARASGTNSAATFGVHHATALAACQIIANNAWAGFLSLDKDGTRPADQQTSHHGILTQDAYYFVVAGELRSCAWPLWSIS